MRRLISIITIAIVATVSSKCSGDGGPVGPPTCTVNCPSTEVITTSISGITNGSTVEAGSVTLSATATSTKLGNITDGSRYSWTINGTSAGNGLNVTLNVQPGTHNVCVSVQGAEKTASDCRSFTATRTKITGKVVVLDLGIGEIAPIGVRVSFSKGASSASAVVNGDGSFQITTTLVNDDSVTFVVDAVNPSDRLYHPMKGIATRVDMAKDVIFIMIPLSVVMPNGTYANTMIPVDLNKAYVAGNDNSPFYRRILAGSVWQYTIASHPVIPVPVAFRNDLGDIPITANDSVPAWGHIGTLEQYVGLDFFRPAVSSELNTMFGISIYVLSTTGPSTAYGGSSVNGSNLGSGVAYFRTIDYLSTLGNGGGLRHELIHALGFGHGCGWKSLQNACSSGIDLGNNQFTIGLPSSYDAAYIRLMYKTRDLERKYNTRFSIMESHQGERELMLGLPAEKVIRNQ